MADDLNLAWHRLYGWPDVLPGFKRLHTKYILAPCSNGRPGENGPETGETAPRVAVDFAASGMEDLATQLGC